MSFIATAIGIVAIFFPDLFNLQKKKIESFTGELSTQEDVKNFEEFLEQRYFDKGIFYLDVMACLDSEYKYLSYDDSSSSGIEKHSSINVINPPDPNDEYMTKDDFDERGVCRISHCGGTVYYFPEEVSIEAYNFRHTGGMCANYSDNGLRIRGYLQFMEGSGQMHQGIVENVYNYIPDHVIKLKEY